MAVRQVGDLSDAEIVSGGVRWAALVMLLLTPFSTLTAVRILVREGSQVEVGFPGIRRYRLVGAALYLAIPLGVVVLVFPLGLLGLPFYVWWMFAPHAVLVEGDGGRTAARRSRTMFQGEFSATAFATIVSFVALLLTLAMVHNLVPGPPRGGFVLNEDDWLYVRQLGDDERYDPDTRILTQADGRSVAMHGATYDEETRALTRPAPPPIPRTTALVWGGIPLILAGLLDPIRWLVSGLLYINLRTRREGLTLKSLLRELGAEPT